MNIAKYPFAVLSAALFTVMLITPISSISNLIWLASADMPVGFITWIEVILFDFQRLGIALYAAVIIGFGIAFSVAGLISRYSSYSPKYLFAVAGAVAIGMALFLMVELLFQTQLLGGNRSIIGKILHCVAGFFGGYFFYSLVSVERSYTFIIRFLGILYGYLLFGSVLAWIFTPISAAADFGFVLNELSNEAQNALLRDFTSFFLATFLFTILGVITLNPVWFFSAGIIYIGAAIFNLIAIYVYGTEYNQIFFVEFLLGGWPTCIAVTILLKEKSH
ncbi:hypothetical protein N9J63_03615 [Gammaproteobacteria bacterium]|nr:hypothetical protein [Gammaproteobacteria bacterium]